MCHEALRGLALVLREPEIPLWDDADEQHRKTVTDAVALAQSGHSPSYLHDEWCMKMLDRGWHYGHKEDRKAKASPRMQHYSKLPRIERAKDAVVFSIAQALSDV